MRNFFKIITDTDAIKKLALKEAINLDNILDIDTVINFIRKHDIDTEDIVIEQCTTTKINSSIEGLMRSEYSSEELRDSHRREQNLKQFNSPYMENDWELPYDFDLCHDIKSEGHLAYLLDRDNVLPKSIAETCLDYGYTTDYLWHLKLTSAEGDVQ